MHELLCRDYSQFCFEMLELLNNVTSCRVKVDERDVTELQISVLFINDP